MRIVLHDTSACGPRRTRGPSARCTRSYQAESAPHPTQSRQGPLATIAVQASPSATCSTHVTGSSGRKRYSAGDLTQSPARPAGSRTRSWPVAAAGRCRNDGDEARRNRVTTADGLCSCPDHRCRRPDLPESQCADWSVNGTSQPRAIGRRPQTRVSSGRSPTTASADDWEGSTRLASM